jgi:hypothetical protein
MPILFMIKFAQKLLKWLRRRQQSVGNGKWHDTLGTVDPLYTCSHESIKGQKYTVPGGSGVRTVRQSF